VLADSYPLMALTHLDAYAIGGLGTLDRTAGLAEMAAPPSQEAIVRPPGPPEGERARPA